MKSNQNKTSWRDEQALQRYTCIAPLLQSDLDSAKKLQLRESIAEQNGISQRTLYRYEKAFREKGFEGLKPSLGERTPSKKLPENYEELVNEAIQLKREVPKRSVEQIITILELEGRVLPGVLARSTLQRYLYNAGFGVQQMKMYRDARKSSSKRFCKPHRMMLIQGDIKYGPELPIGKNGAKVKTYLSSAIDDHSRFLLASRFYDNQEETIVEDTFRTAITRFGKFDACYFDNGSQYIARQLKLSLAKLGISVHHAPVQSGKSKGKIEKFHQVVDTFLREFALEPVRTLETLNRKWTVFVEAHYLKHPHEGIAEYYESLNVPVPDNGITPEQEFNRDSRALTYLDVGVVAEAFLHHEKRKVDKGACISFWGRKYETKSALIGSTVEIAYDPQNPEVITVSYPGLEPFQANPLKIGSFCDKNPSLPLCMQAEQPESSRLLSALEKKYEQERTATADAISFASLGKEMKKHV